MWPNRWGWGCQRLTHPGIDFDIIGIGGPDTVDTTLEKDDVEHCIAGGAGVAIGFCVVIAIAKNGRPFIVGHLDNRGLTIGVSQVGIVDIREFPQHELRGVGFLKRRGRRDVESKNPLSALAQATD